MTDSDPNRFEILNPENNPIEAAGIFIVDHGRGGMAAVVMIKDLAHAQAIKDALDAGVP